MAFESLTIREAVHTTNSSGMVEEEVLYHPDTVSFRFTSSPKKRQISNFYQVWQFGSYSIHVTATGFLPTTKDIEVNLRGPNLVRFPNPLFKSGGDPV